MKNVIHFFESTEHRRNRIGGLSHGQSLCSSGDGHQITTNNVKHVTCEKCIELMKTDPIYSILLTIKD